ncbi:type II toxin-antitoxin system VapC family toxin [Chlorobium sp. BLA1]|uniref:type II toxin-antitoxin system VapC family toxin n=1 Tax=Candidatus Chlorobium masyuteum TaxID=2716876 RepID=UPI001423AF00|nr:type II toxin-antitoxin system VapC family toxin [Candidatus Chlorobium masyuteum]NHQ61005.1 type II toxin-antitoxin system VapC family toxin [Candidatus Chlorobium masyuteum]
MKYLLDTCVISELVRPLPSPKVMEWIDRGDEQDFFLSVITLGEIEKGISKLADGKKKTQLQAWLAYELPERFNGRILTVTTEVALQWGGILGDAEKKGKALPVIDALIAATAITNGLTLVTRNTSDMTASGAPLFDPWE